MVSRLGAAIVVTIAVAALWLAGILLSGSRAGALQPQHVTFYMREAPQKAVPLPHAVPRLVDQRGKQFTFGDLRGKPLVVVFVAAHCTDACPLINAQFAQAAHDFAIGHIDIRLLTVTLDPQHDPPSVMRALAQRFEADPKHWIFASGKTSDVHAVMQWFGVVAQQGQKGYADVHTTYVYFMNSRGQLQKLALASTNLASQIVDDVRTYWHDLTV